MRLNADLDFEIVGRWALRVGIIFAGLALAAVLFWCTTVPPDPIVREGKVVAHDFEPAHDYTYTERIWIGQTCSGSGSTQVCTPNYIYVQKTGHEPDHWRVTLEGCPRRAKDSEAGCNKPKRWEIEVTHKEFDQYTIGSMMKGLT